MPSAHLPRRLWHPLGLNRSRGKGGSIYVSVSRLRVPADAAPDLVAAFRSRAGLVDGFDGFIDLEVWQSDRDASELLMVSRWRDRASFKRYMASEEHRVSHGRIAPCVKEAVRLERLEHLHTYDVVAR